MVLSMLFKTPVSYALGFSSLLVLLFTGKSIVTIAQYSFAVLDSFALLAIPFYIFSGCLMEYSGISRMLIDWIKSLIGRIRGATGIITICACMAFGVLTGSAMATISAIGKIMAPEMEKEKYPRGYISALLAATCFLGILIPPSVPGIMYALVSGAKISEIWVATIGPAFLFSVGYIIINYFRIGKRKVKQEKLSIPVGKHLTEIAKNTIFAFPALLMPIIIYGCIYGGICTATEAGALSAVYGIIYFVIVKIIRRNRITISLWQCCAIAGAATAVIGLLNAFSVVAGKAMTLTGISNYLSALITSNISSKVGFLIMINILFLFMGTFMDINATVLIMTPLLLPVATTYGITAIHFGTILLVNMCVGFLTPPFAVGIFVSSKIANAITMHKGIAEKCFEKYAGKVPLVLKLTTFGVYHFDEDVLVADVEEAVRMGADAVSVGCIIGGDNQDQQIQMLSKISKEATSYGMPLISHIYPRGNKIVGEDQYKWENVAYAARIAAELGVDIVKTNYTGSAESFAKVVEATPTRVAIAGGTRGDRIEDYLQMTKDVLDAGGIGVTYGRVVFQYQNPTALIKTLHAIIHKGASVKEAIELLHKLDREEG